MFNSDSDGGNSCYDSDDYDDTEITFTKKERRELRIRAIREFGRLQRNVLNQAVISGVYTKPTFDYEDVLYEITENFNNCRIRDSLEAKALLRKPVLQTLGDASTKVIPLQGSARETLVQARTFKHVLQTPAFSHIRMPQTQEMPPSQLSAGRPDSNENC